jgi:hypothetical protein
MFDVGLLVRALLPSQVIEFRRLIRLPFVPVAWMVLHEESDLDAEKGFQVGEVTGDMGRQRFLCRLLDDEDAPNNFGDDADGLKKNYANRGREVFQDGPIARVFISGQPA